MFLARSLILLLGVSSTLIVARQDPNDDVMLSGRATPGIFDSGVKDNQLGSAENPKQHVFLEAQRLEKNATMETLHDRSLQLVRRQNCAAGSFACPAASGCCFNNRRCCTYGYCMDTGNTCCPGGSCPPGNTCCGASTCNPIGTQCCSDGNYCSEGNICVIYSGRRVCCTDLSCTAYISNGATIRSTTTAAAPPRTTTRDTVITPAPVPVSSRIVETQYETWYYTVTWWYYSYYWTILRAESTVTRTTIYTTMTYTTEALDRADASSRFAVLSSSLTFNPPASATSLRGLFGVVASDTPTPIARIESTRGPTQVIATGTSSQSTSAQAATSSTVGTMGQAGERLGVWNVWVYAILSSMLSLVL